MYKACLDEIEGITYLNHAEGVDYNYAYFPIFVDQTKYGRTRDELYEHLKTYNYFGRRYFYPLISSFNAYKELPSAKSEKLPVANRIANNVICLPIYPDLDQTHVKICWHYQRFQTAIAHFTKQYDSIKGNGMKHHQYIQTFNLLSIQ